jgi:hypothetical protein
LNCVRVLLCLSRKVILTVKRPDISEFRQDFCEQHGDPEAGLRRAEAGPAGHLGGGKLTGRVEWVRARLTENGDLPPAASARA